MMQTVQERSLPVWLVTWKFVLRSVKQGKALVSPNNIVSVYVVPVLLDGTIALRPFSVLVVACVYLDFFVRSFARMLRSCGTPAATGCAASAAAK